jgi:predicted  nucleic acid-binding Zn-ribbon protein
MVEQNNYTPIQGPTIGRDTASSIKAAVPEGTTIYAAQTFEDTSMNLLENLAKSGTVFWENIKKLKKEEQALEFEKTRWDYKERVAEQTKADTLAREAKAEQAEKDREKTRELQRRITLTQMLNAQTNARLAEIRAHEKRVDEDDEARKKLEEARIKAEEEYQKNLHDALKLQAELGGLQSPVNSPSRNYFYNFNPWSVNTRGGMP